MDNYYPSGMSKEEWIMSNPAVIDYHHQHRLSRERRSDEEPSLDDLMAMQIHLNASSKPVTKNFNPEQMTSSEVRRSSSSTQDTASFPDKYNPFVKEVDMDISDDESSYHSSMKRLFVAPTENLKPEKVAPTHGKQEVKSGAAFYQGLVLYIPPFERLKNTYKGSPAMKMLYASFEFSLKKPVKFEIKPIDEKDANVKVLTVSFCGHIIATGSDQYSLVEASVRALEVLSETCYTIQAKEDYFSKCKLIDGDSMKTLNLKKWEFVCQKYPKLQEITKESHIQKTFAVFLDNHTSVEGYEDIVFCNLTRVDVNNIKRVAEFFNLTMLPCSISTNMSKKQSPCVVSIHKYTSAQKLLDILIESGGENDKFKLFPPDTFKDFYKLHQRFWDPALKNTENISNMTLIDEELQATIMKPYENTLSEMFIKHKSLPKVRKGKENVLIRKESDDFMKETLQIDVAHSKSKVPVERMQLLLKYMENLQEYGNRVLTSGKPQMIKIYHSAIENLRKDLDICRKDIEKDQKEKSNVKSNKKTDKRTPAVRRSKSPTKRGHRRNLPDRSTSPKHKTRNHSPKSLSRAGKSLSPRRRSKSPIRRPKSRSPIRRPKSRSPIRRPRSRSPIRRPRSPIRRNRSRSPTRRSARISPQRKCRSPLRKDRSPQRPARSPNPVRGIAYQDYSVTATIFQDQLKKYIDILRRFRIEIEDTPIERRSTLDEKLIKYKIQFTKLYEDSMDKRLNLGKYLDELDLCKQELDYQTDLVKGTPGPNDLPRSIYPPAWTLQNFDRLYPNYIPDNIPDYGASIPPPPGLYSPRDLRYQY